MYRILLICTLFSTAWAQRVPVREIRLDNGMKVLLVQRKGSPNISAGWIAKVGSVNEHSGVTGISHLFEHMMFKGTQTLGTKNIEEDLKLNLELDRVKGELREEEQALAQRLRVGEIADAKDPQARSPRHQQLLAEFDRLNARQKDLLVRNEFDKIYTTAGATGMNAGMRSVRGAFPTPKAFGAGKPLLFVGGAMNSASFVTTKSRCTSTSSRSRGFCPFSWATACLSN